MTIKENFETSLELVESFQKVQIELIKTFWDDVAKEISISLLTKDYIDEKIWIFEANYYSDSGDYQLILKHFNDTEQSLIYLLNTEVKLNGKSKLGVFLENNLIKNSNIDFLEKNKNDFIKDKWKLVFNENKLKNGWMISDDVSPLFSIQDFNELKIILPQSIERHEEINRSSEKYLEYFDKKVQKYIHQTLEINSIIS